MSWTTKFVAYQCPTEKIRLGKPNDGGYVVANYGDYDHFVSAGISSDVTFEVAAMTHFRIPSCVAYDGTIHSLPSNSPPNIQWHKQNVGDGTNGTSDLVSEVSGFSDVLFKIDVEGHEFRVMPRLRPHMHRIKQLVMEVHTPGDIHRNPGYFAGLTDIQHEHMVELFDMLRETHVLIHVHPNNGPPTYVVDGVRMPCVFETTWIRKSDWADHEWHESRESLPTPIDQPNVTWNGVVPFTFPFSV